MARTVITTDDLDGSTGAETITFSYDGASYSIDLGKKNRAAFEKALKPYLTAAQKTPRTGRAAASTSRRRPSSSRRRSGSPDLSLVRAWAKENGIEVSERGRISQSVIDAYSEAN